MDKLIIAGRSFNSRLLAGTGKFNLYPESIIEMPTSGIFVSRY